MGGEASKNRDALRQVIESKLDDAASKQAGTSREFREELNSSFQRLGDRVSETLTQTDAQQKERLDNSAQAIAALTDKHEKTQETLRLAVESRLDAIRLENAAKLDEMRQMVDEKLQSTLETRLGESFARVVEQLNQMHQGIGEMKTLAASVGDLKHILTNPKIRGTFGEVQLSLLLEEFLAPDQYMTNAQVREGSGERVEFAIKMPGRDGHEVLLPVDAKFPIEDYQRLIAASEASDPELVTLFRRQLHARIRGCAKDIRDKYINPPTTTDFGVMFLPIESLYAEVLREPGVLESLQRDYRVTVAGPTTFGAYLNALQMGFRTLVIEKRSSEVWQVLGAVRAEFGKYNGVVQALANQLNRAVTSVDKLGTRTRVMARTLKAVETVPDETAAQRLLGLTPDELSIEEVELQEPVEDLTSSEIDVTSSEIIVHKETTS
jgi:DNA recombination protein RmuC